jgi:hypothetical protein
MSIADAWDRMFWSLMLVIFIGLVWMRFLQNVAACEGPGLLVALGAGVAFFYRGYRQSVERGQQAEQARNAQEKESL